MSKADGDEFTDLIVYSMQRHIWVHDIKFKTLTIQWIHNEYALYVQIAVEMKITEIELLKSVDNFGR